MYISDPEIEKKEIINRYRSLLRTWRLENPEQKKDIRKAFNIAVEAHKDMRRRTGEPYIYHPLEVARIVAGEIGLGKTSIICALLHDVVEDTDFTLADIEKQFGKPAARIIDGLTKIKDILDIGSPSIQAENFKKMLLTLSNDVRVILIKLADRLHNMRTLESMPLNKQLKIASETSFLYAPLAHRLGLYAIKTELEDLALKHAEPEIYEAISERLRSSEKERKRLANRFIYPIKKSLSNKDFKFEILYRNKSVHSIWNKMKTKGIPLEEVYDLMAVRIIIDTEPENEKVDCWRVYSILTDHYRPKFDRLRDWISIPKANGYEALHTTVMSKDGNWVEVQIRSKRMDEIAEKGYAAHWRYKTANPSQAEMNVNNWLDRIRDMLQGSETNALDFIDDFQGFLFADEIYVFTPTGELRNLPLNSSVLDFAYAIHSEIGNTCIGAKVNYKLAPLYHKLRSGDQVEILTSQKQVPKEEWFNYVVTARARTQIKNGIKEEKKKFAEKGKEMLQSFFSQVDAEYSKNNLKRLQQKYNYANLFDLYYDVAHDLIGLKEVRDCCSETARETWFSKMIKNPFSKSRVNEKQTLTDAVHDQLKNQQEFTISPDAVKKISYEISECCHPIPGDDIVGFLTQDESIHIHRTTCPVAVNQMSKFGDRIIRTRWNDKESVGFLTGIEIHGIDEKGFIKQVIKIVTEELDLNIKSFHIETEGQMIEGKMMLYVYSLANLNQLLNTLKKLPSIKKVSRLHSHVSH
jgi:GTP diphosphokinase / guanosine-3',5'-bis(diphosphate) 3'-diphosphatase